MRYLRRRRRPARGFIQQHAMCHKAVNVLFATSRVYSLRTRRTQCAAPCRTAPAQSVSAYSFSIFVLLQWVGSTGYALCRRHSAWCGAFCTACPHDIYPSRRYEASHGPETWSLVGENRAHGVGVGEDAAISDSSPRSQRAASGSSPLNPLADRLKIRTSVLQMVIMGKNRGL
jgi:hypothetical protein